MKATAKWFVCGLASIASALGLGLSAAHAQSPPSLQIGDAPAISPANAWTYFSGVGLTSPTRASDALIERTAAALGDDPTRIFAFVHNEMEVVPLFGVQKGARGCLIDKACTPFDQVHLLAELLRAAGQAPVYKLGEVTLSLAQMTDWLGVSNQTALNEVLGDSGIPYSVSGTTYTLLHLWVEVTIGAQTYQLDPSFKSHSVNPGLADLDSIMGFNASAFMSSALSGASSSTSGAPQVAAFNRDNLRANLQTYSVNLLNDIRANHANDDIEDIVGGRDIVPVQGTLPATPGYLLGTIYATFANDVPLPLRTQTTITVGSATPFAWALDEIYGEELALIPMEIFPQQGSPDPLQYRFYRNGQAMTGWLTGASASLSVAFNHPYAANGGAYLDRTLRGGGVFHAGAIQFLIGAGRMTPDYGAYLEARSSGEEGYVSIQATGMEEPPDPSVTGGQRATKRRYAVSFGIQFSSALAMASELGDASIVLHDLLVSAHTVPMLGTSVGPMTTLGAVSVEGAISANASSGSASETQAVRRATGALLGVLEGSAVEQNLDAVYPVSTATRFDWFSGTSEHSSTNRRFYWANSSNWSYVSAAILADGYYGWAESRDLAESYVNAGFTVIVPRSSYLGPGLEEVIVCNPGPHTPPAPQCAFPGPERGAAIIAVSPTGVAHVVTAQNRRLKGGGGTNDAETNPTRIFSIPEDFLERQFTSRAEAYNVDMATGAVTYTPPPDLVVGEGEYPYSLSFQRSYRSGGPYQRNYADPGPPRLRPRQERFGDSGWTSNWMAEARMENDGQRAFGEQSPREATDTIAAIRVLLALSADQGSDLATLQYQLGAIHALAWWSEQLSYNAIQLVQGGDNRSFLRLADDTYQGQPGDPTQVELFGTRSIFHPLLKAGSRWAYNGMCTRATNRDGSISYYGSWNVGFTACDTSASGDPPGRITVWMRFRRQSFREGVIVSFDDFKLSNNLGRSITMLTVSDQQPNPQYTVRDDTVQSRTATINLDLSAGPGVMSVTGTDGNTWVYNGATDANWRVFAPSSATSPIVTFDYVWCTSPPCAPDTRVRGQVAELTDAGGNDAQYQISTGRIAAMVDPLGNTARTYFDERSQPIRLTNRLGFDTFTEYDNFRRVENVTYPEGNREEYGYDPRHNRILTRRVPKPGSGLSPTETEATYDTLCNMPLTETDARGNATSYALLPGRCLISTVTQPAVDDGVNSSPALESPITTYTWNDWGQLLTRTDPTGRVTTNAYNASHYLQSVTAPGGAITQFGRNAQGDITSVIDPRGYVHTGTYDLARRLTRYDGPSGTNAATRWTYNPDGLVTLVEQATGNSNDPWAETIYTYWETGRLKTMTDPDGGVTQYFYDALNRLDHTLDPVNRRSETNYDAEGQVLEELRGVGTADQITYATRTWTPNGLLDWVEDANANRSDLLYDGFDRLARLSFPSPTTDNVVNTSDYEEYGYDANGNRTSVRLRSAETIRYRYDALNRECFKDLPSSVSDPEQECGADISGAGASDVFSGYDLAGRRLYARYPGSFAYDVNCAASYNGVDYCYDAAGRVSAERSYDRALTFAYDLSSNRTRVTYPTATTSLYVDYAYDQLNRVTAVRENGAASGAGLLASYAYDPQSRRTQLQRADGEGRTTNYQYSLASRLTGLDHGAIDGSVNADWTYTYTPAGQVETRTLISAYEWAVGALDDDYEVNGLNQYTEVDGATFDHDARGNLTDTSARRYCYDLENRLTGVANAGGNCVSSPSVMSLTYDPLGRLRQTVGTATTQFLYDGDRLVAEYNGSGVLQRRYAHGPGVDEPLVWYEGDSLGDRRWLITDRQGSVIATVDEDGTLVGSVYRYGPYGEPDDINQWGGSRFRYTGQIALPDAGLYHYKARAYHPGLGRFLQTDPVGYEDDRNLYAYVSNDPVNTFDPSGRCQQVIKNGQTIDAGICPDAATSTMIQAQLQNPKSELSQVDAAAVAQQVPINVRTGRTTSSGAQVDHERVERRRGHTPNGTVVDVIEVTLDPHDRGLVNGTDTSTGLAVNGYAESDQEAIEHAIAGHAAAMLVDIANGVIGQSGASNTAAVDAENRFRQRNNNSFQRGNHSGVITPRNPPTLDPP